MLLSLDHVGFGYGAELLFEDVSFQLGAGDRLALVAPNGQGKSTLLKVIAGELSPDEGQVVIARGAQLGYLHQSHEPEPQATLRQVLLAPFADALAARQRLSEAEHAAASGDPAALEALAVAQDHFHVTGADAIEREVTILAERVGFDPQTLDRRVASLSGGERGRLQLAAKLACRPEVLLLDEPTNHLDLETTAWLEEYLRSFRGAVVVVSHDRAFLDNVCPITAELGLLRFRLYRARYSEYLVQREDELERERKAFTLQRQQIERTEDFIRRNLAGQKTKQAKSRRTLLQKLERIDDPEDIWADARKLGLRFAPCRRSGDIVLEARGLGAARGGRELFAGLDLSLRRGDRLAIIGNNGAGKSTLLKLLAGERGADDQGTVRDGSQLDSGYFDQHLASLDPLRTAVEEVRQLRLDMSADAARQYLARFRFFGDDSLRPIGSLSGGERTRLALAKLLLQPRNFLLLDEPTNHLDIPACEILEEALRHFDGTLIVVSHDRFFLARVSTRVLQLDGARTQLHNEPFHFEIGRGPQPTATGKAAAEPTDARLSFEEQKRAARGKERQQRRIAELEQRMAAAAAEIERVRNEAHTAEPSDWQHIAALGEREQQLQAEIDTLTAEWVTLSDN